MSNMTISIIALAAATIVGCATTGPERFDWKFPAVGSTWQIQQRNTGSYGQDRLSETTRGDGVWEGRPVVTMATSIGITVMADPEMGRWMAIVGRDGKAMTTYDPPIGFQYPLYVGKAWTTRHKMQSVATGRTAEFDYSCKVEAQEKVTVSAGTFNALKVSCLAPGATETYWTSVDHGFFVKTELVRNSAHMMGPGTQRSELVGMKLKR